MGVVGLGSPEVDPWRGYNDPSVVTIRVRELDPGRHGGGVIVKNVELKSAVVVVIESKVSSRSMGQSRREESNVGRG